MSAFEFRLVDAFAVMPFTGNVAGVLFGADDLTDKQMLAIAREFNASETTFILRPTTPGADVRFRWFTPECEVGFCGHATIAAVHALAEEGRWDGGADAPRATQSPAHAPGAGDTRGSDASQERSITVECRAGVLTARIESRPEGRPPVIWLDMPACAPKKRSVAVPPLARRLGLSDDAIDGAIPAIRTEEDDVILAVKALPVLLGLQPPMQELARYCRENGLRGVLVTCRETLSSATAVQSRFFAPAFGVDEDPVTGSVHGPLGLHLVRCGVVPMTGGQADFYCAQAKAGGRAGLVRVVVTELTAGEPRVRIGGSCVTTAAGRLLSLPNG